MQLDVTFGLNWYSGNAARYNFVLIMCQVEMRINRIASPFPFRAKWTCGLSIEARVSKGILLHPHRYLDPASQYSRSQFFYGPNVFLDALRLSLRPQSLYVLCSPRSRVRNLASTIPAEERSQCTGSTRMPG